MRVVGIIAEYNPFHNGHLYQLQQSKLMSQAAAAVVVLSGDFLQRGEPALTDKWLRTQMALKGGADLVLELPAAYAVRSAEAYTACGIDLLAATGVVTDFCCACETPDLPLLTAAAAAAAAESENMQAELKKQLKAGKSFAAARSAALKQSAELQKPNNILAIEYLKAIARQKAAGITLQPWLVQRIGSGHDQPLPNIKQPEQRLASAAAIRQLLLTDPEDKHLASLLPQFSLELLQEYRQEGHCYATRELLFPFVQYELLKQSPSQLAQILGVSEGLENKILQAVKTARSYEELVSNIKSKRYPWVRIQRILLSMLLNYSQQLALSFEQQGGPQYLRVLGANSAGRLLLKQMREKATLPLLTRPARCAEQPEAFRQMLQLDLLAADLYRLLTGTGWAARPATNNSPKHIYAASGNNEQLFGQDYLRHPIIID